MKKALILYGSRYGTAKDTSEKIRDILEKKDIDVKLVNVEEQQPSLMGFDGVLIGTGIKIGMWMKKIKKFLKKHSKELTNRKFKFGFFVNCGTASEKEKITEAKEKYIDNKMQKLELSCDIAAAFGPIYDFSEASRMGNMSQKIMKAGLEDDGWEQIEDILYDLRDMDQIQKFAEDFALLLSK